MYIQTQNELANQAIYLRHSMPVTCRMPMGCRYTSALPIHNVYTVVSELHLTCCICQPCSYVQKLRTELESASSQLFSAPSQHQRIKSVLADLSKTASDFGQITARAVDQLAVGLMGHLRLATWYYVHGNVHQLLHLIQPVVGASMQL